MTRTCIVCGKTFTRTNTEGQQRFATRKTCSRACGHVLSTRAATKAPPPPKPCQHCGAPFEKHKTETPKTFAARKYCSRSCSGKARAAKRAARVNAARPTPPDKTCAACRKPLAQRSGEDNRDYAKRRYCDRTCFYAHQRRPKTNQRGDRDLAFSPRDLEPDDLTQLGKPREYPRVQPLGEPCPTHPSNTIGAWGKCPACEAGQRWAARQRQTVFRPHHEGGR